MWYQKDWFTGSDYYNLKEKQIHAEEIEIKKPLEQKFHERTEIYYVKSGDADIWINGDKYQMKEGVFCCLYIRIHIVDHPPLPAAGGRLNGLILQQRIHLNPPCHLRSQKAPLCVIEKDRNSVLVEIQFLRVQLSVSETDL